MPVGFAHGFCTLVPDTEVFYKVNNVYSSAHDRGVNWADPALGYPLASQRKPGYFVGEGQSAPNAERAA